MAAPGPGKGLKGGSNRTLQSAGSSLAYLQPLQAEFPGSAVKPIRISTFQSARWRKGAQSQGLHLVPARVAAPFRGGAGVHFFFLSEVGGRSSRE